MRKEFKNLMLVAAFGGAVVACSSPKAETEKKEVAVEKTETVEVKEEVKMAVANVNLATEEDLTKMGIAAETVKMIVENRPFLSMKDLDKMVKAEEKEALYLKVFVPMNLNTTAEEDFKIIPGVGERMAHEFEEYRPYTSVEQFRREIGKYVDSAEIARYEQYVFVPTELNSTSKEGFKMIPGVGERMAHELEEYKPYKSMEQFRKEIGKYVDAKELSRLERYVYIK